jgi:DNA-binding HxlR family transcriptional regulator
MLGAMNNEHEPSQELLASVFSRACDSRAMFETVTGKWPSLVLLALSEGPKRFGELRRRVDGVSEKMLSQALDQLETAGMVSRTDHHTQPPRVDYELTSLGVDVSARIKALADVLEATVNAGNR